MALVAIADRHRTRSTAGTLASMLSKLWRTAPDRKAALLLPTQEGWRKAFATFVARKVEGTQVWHVTNVVGQVVNTGRPGESQI